MKALDSRTSSLSLFLPRALARSARPLRSGARLSFRRGSWLSLFLLDGASFYFVGELKSSFPQLLLTVCGLLLGVGLQ